RERPPERRELRQGGRRRARGQGRRQPRERRGQGAGEGLAVIAKMDQVTVVGRRSIAKEVLGALQGLGVVQITPLAPELAAHEAAQAATTPSQADGSSSAATAEVGEQRVLKPLRLSGADLSEKETWDRILA